MMDWVVSVDRHDQNTIGSMIDSGVDGTQEKFGVDFGSFSSGGREDASGGTAK